VDLARQFQPRDAALAARSAAVLCVTGALITLLFAVAQPPKGLGPLVTTWVVPALLALLAVVFARLPERWTRRTALVVPLLGVGTVTTLDLVTHDASAAAQVFLCVPVLYAAWLVRMGGAVLTVVIAAIAEVVINALILPPALAVPNAVYVTATLVSITLLLVRAVERQEQLIARLSAQASTDALTGLCTRRALDETAIGALEVLPPEGVALLLVDVDAFKAVNDTWGHPVGDDALVHIAGCLVDALGADAVLGRLGGDEFAAVLTSCSPESARSVALGVVEAVRARPLRLPSGQHLDLSVSVGTGHTAEPGTTLRELYADADSDLYRAKRSRLPWPRGQETAAPPQRRRNRDGSTSPVRGPQGVEPTAP
jgi:diguanylate cyclase (GGDEF)-like protein